METQPIISYEGIEPMPHIQQRIEAEIDKLERYFGHIISCRVVVRVPGRRHHHGNLYEVAVHLSLPDGREVMASEGSSEGNAQTDLLIAIRGAFDAARRQLQDKARKLRGSVKHHDAPLLAKVRSLIAEKDYGFLETADNQEIYFHRNSVLNEGFDRLCVGDRVSYVSELGEMGLQASTVKILGKHNLL